MTALQEPITSGINAADLITLNGVSWETYELLLRDTAEQHVRITYDQGRLVLMSPLPKHDRTKRWIGRLLETASIEKNVRIGSFGSTTWRKKKLLKGLEPDECYYIQNEPTIRGRVDIDLLRDPPPDLAIEIEITHFPLQRLEIFAALGVREIWRYDGEKLWFLLLGDDKSYSEIPSSHAMPFLNSDDMNRFLKMFEREDENSVVHAFIRWLRQGTT